MEPNGRHKYLVVRAGTDGAGKENGRERPSCRWHLTRQVTYVRKRVTDTTITYLGWMFWGLQSVWIRGGQEARSGYELKKGHYFWSGY